MTSLHHVSVTCFVKETQFCANAVEQLKKLHNFSADSISGRSLKLVHDQLDFAKIRVDHFQREGTSCCKCFDFPCAFDRFVVFPLQTAIHALFALPRALGLRYRMKQRSANEHHENTDRDVSCTKGFYDFTFDFMQSSFNSQLNPSLIMLMIA